MSKTRVYMIFILTKLNYNINHVGENIIFLTSCLHGCMSSDLLKILCYFATHFNKIIFSTQYERN